MISRTKNGHALLDQQRVFELTFEASQCARDSIFCRFALALKKLSGNERVYAPLVTLTLDAGNPMPAFGVFHDMRLIVQRHLLVLEFHLLWRLVLDAVVLCHVEALTAAKAAGNSRQAGLLREILLLDELQLRVGEVRIAEVAVGARVQLVDEVQRVFYHIIFEVGRRLGFEMQLREVYVADGTDGVGRARHDLKVVARDGVAIRAASLAFVSN